MSAFGTQSPGQSAAPGAVTGNADHSQRAARQAAQHTSPLVPFVRLAIERQREVVSRQDALFAGLPYYFTGRPCKHGHHSWRYTSCSSCSACVRRWSDAAYNAPGGRERHNANKRRQRAARRAQRVQEQR